MVVGKEMNITARDNVDIVDAIKRMRDGVADKCLINMHDFEDNSDSGLKTLMMFKNFAREHGMLIKFSSFNGTLPKVREYLRKCAQQK